MKRGNTIHTKTNTKSTVGIRYTKLSTKVLQQLVLDYKQGDTLAAERICQGFTPLVLRLAHRPYVYNSYGEDAENMLWQWLLEFITTYEGDNFRMLPGLIRRHLIFKLIRCAEQNNRRWSTEQTTDLEDMLHIQLADEKDDLQQEILACALKQLLEHLPKKQYHIIRRFYLEQESQKSIADSLHCTPRAVRLQISAALKSIREIL